MEPDGEFILEISLERATAIGEKNKTKKKKKHLTDFTTHNNLHILSTLINSLQLHFLNIHDVT